MAQTMRFNHALAASAVEGTGDDPPAFTVLFKGCGALLCYASHAPAAASVDGQQVGFEYSGAEARLVVAVPRGEALLRECTIQF